jgi:hypothetical protein
LATIFPMLVFASALLGLSTIRQWQLWCFLRQVACVQIAVNDLAAVLKGRHDGDTSVGCGLCIHALNISSVKAWVSRADVAICQDVMACQAGVVIGARRCLKIEGG